MYFMGVFKLRSFTFDVMLRRLSGVIKRCSHPQLYFTQVGKVISSSENLFQTGQFFIAKEYEYRGIILFPQKVELVTDDDRNGTFQVLKLFHAHAKN